MTYKPVPTKKFVQFLKEIGLEHLRSKGDHEIWDYPENSSLLRPVTFISKDKTVPALHVDTNLKTLGMTYKEFNKILSRL
jgi:hypothetical protein